MRESYSDPDPLPGVTAEEWTAETSWRAQAACRDTDTLVFFEPELQSEAGAICRRCSVSVECGEWAKAARISDGFWAGKWAPRWTRNPPAKN